MSWNLFSLQLFFFLGRFSILHGPSNIFDFTADAAGRPASKKPGNSSGVDGEKGREQETWGESPVFSDKGDWTVSETVCDGLIPVSGCQRWEAN